MHNVNLWERIFQLIPNIFLQFLHLVCFPCMPPLNLKREKKGHKESKWGCTNNELKSTSSYTRISVWEQSSCQDKGQCVIYVKQECDGNSMKYSCRLGYNTVYEKRFHAATSEIILSIQKCFQQMLKTVAFARDNKRLRHDRYNKCFDNCNNTKSEMITTVDLVNQ